MVVGQTPPRVKELPHTQTRARKAQTERKASAVEDSEPLFPHMDTSITRRMMQQELRQRKGQELQSGARLSAYYIQGWTVTTQPGSRRDASYRWLSAAKSTTGGGRKSGRNFIWNGFFQAASPERSCRRLRLKGEVRPGSIFLSLPSRWCPMAVLCKHREAPIIGNRCTACRAGCALRAHECLANADTRFIFCFFAHFQTFFCRDVHSCMWACTWTNAEEPTGSSTTLYWPFTVQGTA